MIPTIPPAVDLSTVTGTSTTRLNELRKYVDTNVFANMYFVYNGSNDGVDVINSLPNEKIIYYIGNIRYVDYIDSNGGVETKFKFNTLGVLGPDFINVPYYKTPSKENIIGEPKIDNDVFIQRQELSAFDMNFRLEFIKNLAQLESYGGGNFFNIVKIN